MKMMLRETDVDSAGEERFTNDIELLRTDASLRCDDLLAGRSVSAVLVAVIALGMLAMLFTVLVCL